jgi:hypothetical protein
MDCSACSADMTSDYWDLFGSACYIEANDGCIKSHPEAGAFSGENMTLVRFAHSKPGNLVFSMCRSLIQKMGMTF